MMANGTKISKAIPTKLKSQAIKKNLKVKSKDISAKKKAKKKCNFKNNDPVQNQIFKNLIN